MQEEDAFGGEMWTGCEIGRGAVARGGGCERGGGVKESLQSILKMLRPAAKENLLLCPAVVVWRLPGGGARVTIISFILENVYNMFLKNNRLAWTITAPE
jgi:hypothetical protein